MSDREAFLWCLFYFSLTILTILSSLAITETI